MLNRHDHERLYSWVLGAFLFLVIVGCLIVWAVSMVQAEPIPVPHSPHCNSISWTPNPEPDMAQYCMHYRRPWITTWTHGGCVDHPTTVISCEQVGITSLGVWELRLTATDTSGNVSGPSESVATLNFPPITFATLPVTPPPPIIDPPPTTDPLAVDVVGHLSMPIQEDTVKVGAKVYSDRSFTLTAIPPAYAGAILLRTPNNDKTGTNPNSIILEIDGDAEICVAYDERIPQRPAWMSGYVWNQVDVLLTSDPAGTRLPLYCQAFMADSVITLGGNAGNSQSSMYVVVVQ